MHSILYLMSRNNQYRLDVWLNIHTHTHTINTWPDIQSGQKQPTYAVHKGDLQSAPPRLVKSRLACGCSDIWRSSVSPGNHQINRCMILCLSHTGRTRQEGKAEELCGSADGGSSVGGEVRSGEGLGSGTGRSPVSIFFSPFITMKESQLLQWSLLAGSDLCYYFNIIQVGWGLLKVEEEPSRVLQWEYVDG